MALATTPAPRSYAALPLGWAALLLYLTLAPADKLPPQPKWELLSFDTFAHAAFFAVQAALAWFSLRRQRRWPASARHAGWVVLLGCTAFGALIEGLQMALPFNRHGEWSDLISDSLGTAVALGLCYAVSPALRRRGWALGLLGALLATGAQAQDMPRVRQTIAELASPKMHGRGYVKEGDKVAAAYLRERLKQLKLQPLAPAYMQSFGLNVNTFPGAVKLRVFSTHKQKPISAEFKLGTDFIVAPDAPALRHHTYTIVSADTSALIDDGGRVAAILSGLSDNLPRQALLLRQLDAKRLQLAENQEVRARWEAVYGPQIVLVDKLTASIAATQGRQATFEVLLAKWPTDLINGDVPVAVEVQVDAQLQRNYQTQNLAAIVRGTVQPDSFLVVSAHYDHLGMMGKNLYFPGANDNASGVAMLLELAAHYARPENRPACSVVFLLFGAEEAGLVGSQYFVAHPLVPLRNIKFLLNLDLLGSGEQGATVVNGRVHEAAFRRLTALNDARRYLPALGARGKAANSDHYPFSEAGVPAFYLYLRGASKAYHDVKDTPATLTLAGFPGAFGLLRDFLNELGARPGQ